MVFHASLSSGDAVVVAADTDDLILIIYADSQYMVKRFQIWQLQCADIDTIYSYLGK